MEKKLVPIEKNEFLSGLEELFKKYGITEAYNRASSFNGTLTPGFCLLVYSQPAEKDKNVIRDYVRGSYDVEDDYCPLILFSKGVPMDGDEPVYSGGNFYAY